jgi:hypothetical protein
VLSSPGPRAKDKSVFRRATQNILAASPGRWGLELALGSGGFPQPIKLTGGILLRVLFLDRNSISESREPRVWEPLVMRFHPPGVGSLLQGVPAHKSLVGYTSSCSGEGSLEGSQPGLSELPAKGWMKVAGDKGKKGHPSRGWHVQMSWGRKEGQVAGTGGDMTGCEVSRDPASQGRSTSLKSRLCPEVNRELSRSVKGGQCRAGPVWSGCNQLWGRSLC